MKRQPLGRIGRAGLLASATIAWITVSAPPAEVMTSAAAPSATFTLDEVRLTASGSALPPGAQFDATPSGSTDPSASATTRNPYRELTVETVPFGTEDGEDPELGVAAHGRAAAAAAALKAFRSSQHASFLGTFDASLFGREVSGSASLVSLQVDSEALTPVAIVEWVTEAGPRLWLVRTAEAIVGTAATTRGAAVALTPTLSDVTLSGDPSAPSTELSSIAKDSQGSVNAPFEETAGSAVQGLPTPSWWSGNCDTNHYAAAAGEPAYPLGADWYGLEACGPRPYYGEGPDVAVLYPGAKWSVLEWECVELSMRWIYQAWGVEPYPANGSGVVWNYATTQATYNPGGPALVAVSNNGSGPMPQPGDVLSYGTTSSDGHTSVVTSTSIDASGDGTVTVEEENASADGWDTVPVTNSILGGFDGGVTGWLHNPGFSIQPPDAEAAAAAPDGAVWSLDGDDASTPTFGDDWSPQGGEILDAPSIVSVPSASGPGTPLFLATGVDNDVWVSAEAVVWQRLSPPGVVCTSRPGANVVDATPGTAGTYVLTVACRGEDGALWYSQGPVSTPSASSMPWLPSWSSLGGLITSGPAIAAVAPASSLEGELTFFADGADGYVWTRTVPEAWSPTSWACHGDPAAAAVERSTLFTIFACQGVDGALWVATNAGAGWSEASSWGGKMVGGPGIAAAPVLVTVVAEGTDRALWQTTETSDAPAPDGWVSAGSVIADGAAAAELLAASASP